jgi:hypothetical protein
MKPFGKRLATAFEVFTKMGILLIINRIDINKHGSQIATNERYLGEE